MNESDQEDALDRIYADIDAMFRSGAFAEVNVLLENLSPETSVPIQMLAYASITTSARERLPARAAFIGRLRRHLAITRSPREADELLAGLE